MPLCTLLVSGRGAFPVDMLRFAEAWPVNSEDVAKIEQSITGELRGSYEVRLYAAHTPMPHTLKRWDSFGWKGEVVR